MMNRIFIHEVCLYNAGIAQLVESSCFVSIRFRVRVPISAPSSSFPPYGARRLGSVVPPLFAFYCDCVVQYIVEVKNNGGF